MTKTVPKQLTYRQHYQKYVYSSFIVKMKVFWVCLNFVWFRDNVRVRIVTRMYFWVFKGKNFKFLGLLIYLDFTAKIVQYYSKYEYMATDVCK